MMKRVIYLIVVALVALMLFVPSATAQEETKGKAKEKVQEAKTKIEQTTEEKLPASGGAPVGSMLLPAAALLVGSGVMAYVVLRRR